MRFLYSAILLLLSAATIRTIFGGREGSENAPAPPTPPAQPGMETATFAAGCFWGVEATFRGLKGVVNTQVGYTGGHTTNPTYRAVCKHDTGHAEALKIEFDPAKISYQQLLEVFFEHHDPTTLDRQGPDVGDQYRSAIFFHSAEQERLAKAEKEKRDRSGEYRGPLVTEIVPAGQFYPAEEYHQRYFEKQGVEPTCHIGNGKKSKVSGQSGALGVPALVPPEPAGASCGTGENATCGLTHWQDKTDAEWRKLLTPEQYRIAREAGTEEAFTGKYWNTHTAGIYQCAACGQKLFSSETKFDSGTGWPSFYAPVSQTALTEHKDESHGRVRVEIRCSQCGAHLGHVFEDGPKPTGRRYCLNSAVLELVPAADASKP